MTESKYPVIDQLPKSETDPMIKLLSAGQCPDRSLSFLLSRNEKPEPITYSLLRPVYNLQFPRNLPTKISPETGELEETGHMDEPESPDDYWLDIDQTTQCLAHLDLMAIYLQTAENHPFVTIESFQNALIKTYHRHYQKHSQDYQPSITPELMAEYLKRFFNGISVGVKLDLSSPDLIEFPIEEITSPHELPPTTNTHCLKVIKNKFDQIILVPV